MGFLEKNYLRQEHLDGFDNYKVGIYHQSASLITLTNVCDFYPCSIVQ